MDEDLKKNAEGYPDPTPYQALLNIERERIRKTVGCIQRVCELSGFELVDRIVLRDKKTGKIWR